MEACYGGTDVMERSCAVARGIDINTRGGIINTALYYLLIRSTVYYSIILYRTVLFVRFFIL